MNDFEADENYYLSVKNNFINDILNLDITNYEKLKLITKHNLWKFHKYIPNIEEFIVKDNRIQDAQYINYIQELGGEQYIYKYEVVNITDFIETLFNFYYKRYDFDKDNVHTYTNDIIIAKIKDENYNVIEEIKMPFNEYVDLVCLYCIKNKITSFCFDW